MGENVVLQPGVSIKPVLDSTDVKKIIFEHYGINIVNVVELNGYDDKNFHVTSDLLGSKEDGYTFKVINSLDSKKPELFDAQNLLLIYLNNQGIRCPTPVAAKDGSFCKKIQLKSGEHIVRLLEFINGTVLHKVTCNPKVFYQLGEMVAQVDIALKEFHHLVYDDHKTLWMLESLPKLREFIFVVTDENRRSMCSNIIKEFEERVLPKIDKFERGMIHGDINEQNILVEDKNGKINITAILDFGDSYRGCYLFELAVMMTYMILDSKDLNVGSYILAGYFTLKKLSDEEYQLLIICICARLCTSLVMGAYTFTLEPENKYLLLTSTYGWQLLEHLRSEPEDVFLRKWKTMAEEFLLTQ